MLENLLMSVVLYVVFYLAFRPTLKDLIFILKQACKADFDGHSESSIDSYALREIIKIKRDSSENIFYSFFFHVAVLGVIVECLALYFYLDIKDNRD